MLAIKKKSGAARQVPEFTSGTARRALRRLTEVAGEEYNERRKRGARDAGGITILWGFDLYLQRAGR